MHRLSDTVRQKFALLMRLLWSISSRNLAVFGPVNFSIRRIQRPKFEMKYVQKILDRPFLISTYID